MRDRIAHMLNLPMTALIQRDLVRHLRRVRPLLALMGMLTVFGICHYSFWPEGPGSVTEMVGLSSLILRMWVTVLLVSLVLFMPSFGATSIITEREEQTYDMLSMTLISPMGFVVGKLAVLMGFYAALMAGCMPLLATVFFLTGLDWSAFVMNMGVIAVVAVGCASFSLLASTMASEASNAVRLAFLGGLWVMGLPIGMFASVAYPLMARVPIMGLHHHLYRLVPFWFVEMAMQGAMGVVDFVAFVLYHTATATVVLLLAWWRLARAMEPPAPDDDTAAKPGAWVRLKHIVLGGYPPQPPLRDRENPVCGLESRYGIVTRGPARRRMFGASLLLTAFVAYSVGGGVGYMTNREAVLIPMGMVFALLCLISPAIAANSITKERERGNLDAVRSTPLTPYTIVWGKAKAALRLLLTMEAACILAVSALALMSPSVMRYLGDIACGFVSVAVCCFVVVAASMVASCAVTRTPNAVALSFVLGWGVLTGAPLAAAIVFRFVGGLYSRDSFLNGAAAGRILEFCVKYLSPVTVYIFDERRASEGFLAAWTINVIVFTSVGVALLWWASRLLESRFRRDA